MRCISCNTILDDDETSTKFTGSTEYVDLCYSCLETTDIFEDDEEDFSDDTRSEF